MEKNFDENSKLSMFNYIKNSKYYSNSFLSAKNIQNSIQKNNTEYNKILYDINQLSYLVTQRGNDIKKYIDELEFLLDSGSNDKNLRIAFYSSKIFLDVINLLNITLPEYEHKLLIFIEKLLSNKLLSKYLSKNHNFFPKILSYIKSDSSNNMIEIITKISEIILINGLFPLKNMVKTLNNVYNILQKNNKLNIFSRILGILIFDCKKSGVKQIFKCKETVKTKSLTKTTTMNQSIVLNLPDFIQNILEKLKFTLIQTKNYVQHPNLYPILLSEFPQTIDLNVIKKNENECYKSFLNKNIKNIPINEKKTKKKIDLNQNELINLFHLNIFQNFLPDFSTFPKKNEDNIYNTYKKLTKNLCQMKNASKIQQNKKQFVSLFKYATNQIEMLFVLSTLLGSKRKIEIQDKLGDLNIIENLSSYLEFIEWGNIFNNNIRPAFAEQRINIQDDSAYHGPGCCCDCDTALKIQYLRLIYSFCCRDGNNFHNKIKLFSIQDVENFLNKGYFHIIQIFMKQKYEYYKNKEGTFFNKNFDTIYEKLNLSQINPSKNSYDISEDLINMCDISNIQKEIDIYNKDDNKVGLLQKLIYKYMQECYYSSAKFWLSSCIEVILRGNNSFFQTYLACSGLMPCLLYDILYSNSDQSQILQLSFDILGELIKLNKGNFYILNYFLVDKKEFSDFCIKVIHKDKLVDSNVFLRAIILTNYFFDEDDKKNKIEEKNYFTNGCKICSFIKKNLYKIFILLINVVKETNVNQTNISCINTGLLILIIEYLKNNLSEFLNKIKEIFKEEAINGLKNFKGLLKMWINFYHYRPKDSASLQYSTTISFNNWEKVTRKLLEEELKDL